MELNELKEMISIASNDELSKIDAAHVHLVFDDGEIVCTKGGNLLFHRTLHCHEEGGPVTVSKEIFPHEMAGHGYAFVSREDARLISNAIKGLLT